MQDNLDESTTAIIEHFTVLIYDRTSELLSINEKKWDFNHFTQKSRNLERIPHTQRAFKEHIKRACYQVNCWDKASIPKPINPKPPNRAWSMSVDTAIKWQSLWTAPPQDAL